MAVDRPVPTALGMQMRRAVKMQMAPMLEILETDARHGATQQQTFTRRIGGGGRMQMRWMVCRWFDRRRSISISTVRGPADRTTRFQYANRRCTSFRPFSISFFFCLPCDSRVVTCPNPVRNPVKPSKTKYNPVQPTTTQ